MPIIHQTERSKKKDKFIIRLKSVISGWCISMRIMMKSQSRIRVLRSWKNMRIILWVQVMLGILYMDRCIKHNKTDNIIMKRERKRLKKEDNISLENMEKMILESTGWYKLRLKATFQTTSSKKNNKTQNNSKEASQIISASHNFPQKTTQSIILYMRKYYYKETSWESQQKGYN